MMPAASFLDALKVAAGDAVRAEDAFRRDVAERAKVLERERAYAHRRLNFMRAIAEAIASAESEEIAVAAATAVMRIKLGWTDDSEARTETLELFVPVAKAMFASLDPEEPSQPADPVRALHDFEAWYSGARGSAFWLLFENYMPETPRVDF
jgi:hypothetical protein